MSASPQLASADTLVLPFKNFGGSDIAAGLGVLADTSNVPVGDYAGGIVLPTNGGGVVGTLGVTVERIPAGGTGRVRVYGVSVCTANGSITYGTPVQISDTSAKLGYVKTCGSATVMLGIALDGASDGQLVRVLHSIAKNA
jgi:hypothetical protein